MARRLIDSQSAGILCLTSTTDGRLLVGGDEGYLSVWIVSPPQETPTYKYGMITL